MITIKTKEEIEIMREGGRILAEIMEKVKKTAVPGITTRELDRVAETLVFKFKAQPAFKGHNGYPATLCVSVNNIIVHGLPSNYKLKGGDIFSLDLPTFSFGTQKYCQTKIPTAKRTTMVKTTMSGAIPF